MVDDAQAKKIFAKIASIPQLRPHDLIVPNYPGYDDMYQEPVSIWVYGQWVNGGHWSTCEARMMLAYNRLGQFEDARKSMHHMITTFAIPWKMDNPLPDFGNKVWFADRAINITYDAFGPAAGMIRGLFEPIYKADELVLIPHIPPGITELHQRDPIRFGAKRIHLSTIGSGAISSVTLNDKPWDRHDAQSVQLPYDHLPDDAHLVIAMGEAKPQRLNEARFSAHEPKLADLPPDAAALRPQAERLDRFITAMTQAKLGDRPEVAHANLAIACLAAAGERGVAQIRQAQAPPRSRPESRRRVVHQNRSTSCSMDWASRSKKPREPMATTKKSRKYGLNLR